MRLGPSTICNHLDDIVDYSHFFVHFRKNRDSKHVVNTGDEEGSTLVIKKMRRSFRKVVSHNLSFKDVDVSLKT